MNTKDRIIAALWFIFGIFPFWLGGYAFEATRENKPFLFLLLFISALLFQMASTAMAANIWNEPKEPKVQL